MFKVMNMNWLTKGQFLMEKLTRIKMPGMAKWNWKCNINMIYNGVNIQGWF